jgi:hypothetical protein
LGFRILKQEQKETTNKAKSFRIFRIPNRKWKTKQTKTRKLKRQTKRNNGNIFGLFCVLESRNKNKNNKEKKESETWIYKVLTKYDV